MYLNTKTRLVMIEKRVLLNKDDEVEILSKGYQWYFHDDSITATANRRT